MVELEDGLWRAVGITEIDMGVMVGRFPKAERAEPIVCSHTARKATFTKIYNVFVHTTRTYLLSESP